MRTNQSARSLKIKRHSSSFRGLSRHLCFEPLETRQLLAVTLAPIGPQTVLAGAPLNLALDTSGTSNSVSYSVAVNNSNVTAAVPTGNTYLKLSVNAAAGGIQGDMVFQLFNDLTPNTVAKITSLVNADFYDGVIFHRIIENFMIQGGDPTGSGSGGPGFQFDDEFRANLQFTGRGLLAMANGGDDTNGSQFFITTSSPRHLDFQHSIFGVLIQGGSILDALDSVPTGANDRPLSPVTITGAAIVTENQDGVLRLSASQGASGTSLVTVTATDAITNETSVQQFTATIAADTTNDPPFLNPIAPIQTPVNTPVTFNIPATDVEGDAIYYDAIVSPANANLTLAVNHSTGSVTLTPNANLAPGVYSVRLVAAATSTSSLYDSQLVPVYVNPAAPTSVQLLAASDTGSSNSDRVTNLNNSAGKTLQFQVNGVISGAEVELFADGVSIGQAVASGATAVITTNGTVALTDGSHAITAKQTLPDRAVNVGNLQTTADLTSPASTALSAIVDTAAPQFFFTPITTANIGFAYNCQAAVIGDLAGTIAYSLTQSPAGMAVNATTGLIAWTPPTGQASPAQVTLRATDRAGNATETSFAIAIVPPNNPPVLAPASPVLGTIDENTATTIGLGTFINNGAGTTSITDADSSAVVGGIALIGLTGQGIWAYTLDGSTFNAISSVSPSSALLLPQNASLRYTPDGKNGGSATITYRAWDATAGASGGRIDISLPVLVGGNTAFSSATDAASLAVTAVNDAPVLAAANPSLGTTDFHAAKTINLSTFINNGTGTTTFTDVDTGAIVGGVAIFAVAGSGTWVYSLDGATFTAVGTVSDSAALLLPKTAQLRYTPNGVNLETATVSYRAWDATNGAGGDKVDISATGDVGGDKAFSASTDIASLSVIDVNDAPVLTPANPSLGTTSEDAAKTFALIGSFINNGTGTTAVTDADASAQLGGIALVGVTGTGAWAYALDGSTFVTITGVSNSSALLLPKTASLRYTPDGKNGESATIVYRAWDASSGTIGGRANLSQSSAIGGITAFSLASDTAALSVTAVNDAPVLVAAQPSLGSIAPSAVKTFDLADFINAGAGSTAVTDVDASAVVGGIALTGITGAGTWEYSLDGSAFSPVGTVSAASALLLPRDAVLRYTAGTSLSDSPSIAYRAWDTTAGTSNTKVDLSATGAVGGATAYSAAADTASLALAGASLSGYVYIDSNNDGLRTASGGTHYGLPGVPVKLLLKNGSGAWTEVAGKSPVLTAADGSYRFGNLVAGTYRIQEIQPANFLDGKDTAGSVGGTVRGTVGADAFDVQLGGGEIGAEYNFGERGIRPEKITLRMLLASAPTGSQSVVQANAAPVVDLAKSLPGNGFTALFPAGGASVALAAADALAADADSPMLASMKVTLANPLDGNAETLSATVANTSLTSNYANGVLTLSGAADTATYTQVLKTLKYGNTAASPQTANRIIQIVVNDGVADSLPAAATLAATQQTAQAAADSLFDLTDDWLLN
ncbi:MAG: peptidylprolyl isomerase [Pirellulales bacterium]|nr:peptidylprolyl isomerase [Pirellulales bacterium]